MIERVFDRLKLREETVYTKETSGLRPLLFHGLRPVKFMFMESLLGPTEGHFYQLHHLKLEEDTATYESQVSETEYDRLVIPVYLLSADYIDLRDNLKNLKGVLRPCISRNLPYPTLCPNLEPEFHFYLEGPYENYLGKTTDLPHYDYNLYANLMRVTKGIKERYFQDSEPTVNANFQVRPFHDRVIHFTDAR